MTPENVFKWALAVAVVLAVIWFGAELLDRSE